MALVRTYMGIHLAPHLSVLLLQTESNEVYFLNLKAASIVFFFKNKNLNKNKKKEGKVTPLLISIPNFRQKKL